MADSGIDEAAKRRIMEENRLRAKAKVIERERARATSNVPNQNSKRPLEVTPADNTSPTAPSGRHVPSQPYASTSASRSLQQALRDPPPQASGSGITAAKDTRGREIRTSEFVDYDLSTLKNSKGGFLLIEEEDDPRAARQRKLEDERKAQRLKEAARQGLTQDPALSHGAEHPKCQECGTVELDFQMHRVFGIKVCPKCKIEFPDKFSLLTKTECKEDYLLTDPELKDEELLPHLLKPNPHRSSYSNMMLFLRCQVEAFAFSDKKWGSPAALDAEFEKRTAEKKLRKSKKFEEKLKDLRKRNRNSTWHKRQEAAHVHDFGDGPLKLPDGKEVERCVTCYFEVEVESF